jgi:murein DD-endopeptidase MepM/ murein hydrolase activator NlpD
MLRHSYPPGPLARACPLATLLLFAFVIACNATRVPPADATARALDQAQANAVKMITQREGETTHFFVQNDEYCEVTMTFVMRLVNLKSDKPLPYTTTLPARKRTELFTVSPTHPGADWEYDYTNYYKLGSNRAHPDPDCLYRLPYAPGATFPVSQGYNGSFSHTGPNQYAIDFQMPEGTLVCAARAGIVVRVKDDSNTGGPSMKFDPFNNYILIRHADGTLGHYCHLQRHGCLVRVGQVVCAGQPIAHSGNTGFSSGPHLHFCVFMNKDGRHRMSIPVKFITAAGEVATLLEDHSYQAAPFQLAHSAEVAAARPQPSLHERPDHRGASLQ